MKKILSLLLATVLVLSCLTVPAFSADVDSVSAEELEVLCALGIISDSTVAEEQLKAHISRAEAAKYFCNMLGLEIADPTGFESVFYDVTSETPYFKYISTICKAGYMQGDGNGRFRPNAPISTSEAARVLTSLIGYKGFVAVGSLDSAITKTDVIDGVQVVSELEYGQFFKMVYNILHAPACRETGYGQTVTFEISDDYLGMEYLLKVAKTEGVVDGIPGTNLTEVNTTMRDGFISIDGTEVAFSGNASEYLGYLVDVYYKTDAENNDVVFIRPSSKNKTMILNYDEIIGYSNYEYKYEYKNSDKTVKIRPETDVIYNGIACMAPEPEDMVPGYGKVTLVSNDGDSVYDVVMVEDCEFMVVDTINKTKEIIKDRLNNVSFDYSKADEIVVTSEGEAYELDRIYSGNLLAVKRSKENSGYYKISIDVSKNEITGAKVTAVGGDTITANGTKYTLWDGIDDESKSLLTIGKTATIYVLDGMIVGATEEESSRSYAYLLTISKPEVLSNDIRFRMVLPSLEEAIYEKNNKIKIDGVMLSDAEQIRNALLAGANLSASKSADMPLAQPIIYNLSKDGKLTSIDTLYFNSSTEDAETSLKRAEGEKYRYSSHNGGLYVDINTLVASGTNFMSVPVSDRNEVSEYKKTAPSTAYFKDGESLVFAMDICGVDPESRQAEFVFHYKGVDTTADDYSMYIVLSKSVELNSEGETANVLHLGYNGNAYDYTVQEELKNTYEELMVGDIISFDLNGEGKINVLERKARLSTMLTNPPDKADRIGPQLSTSGKNKENKPPYEGARILYAGTAIEISMGKMLFTPSLVTDPEGFDENYLTDILPVGSTTVYKYSVVRGEPTIETGTLDDIVTYRVESNNPTPILVYMVSSQARYIFVVEN